MASRVDLFHKRIDKAGHVFRAHNAFYFWKDWSMDPNAEETTLINRCDESQTYEARLAAGTLPGRTSVGNGRKATTDDLTGVSGSRVKVREKSDRQGQ